MPWQPRKILVPVDFSADSQRALSTALDIAQSPGDVHLLHVLFPLDSVSPGVAFGQVTEEKREQAVRESFDKLLAEAGVAGPAVEVRFGNPGTEIAEYADEIAADLIVIPSHGYHGVKRLLLGSVAERVIRTAHCSVLVLRRAGTE